MAAVSAMFWWQVIVLAVAQGVTEFLPVSSSGHLAIVSPIFFAGDAFVVGLAAVAWLLWFLVRHTMYWFMGHRVVAGGAVPILLGNGTVAAT